MRILWLLVLIILSLPAQGAAEAKEKSPEPSTAPAAPAIPPAPPTRKLVAYEKLIDFLPPVPKDWAADKPDGSMTDTEELRISTAHRSYYLADSTRDDVPAASVTIIDSTNNDDFFDTDSGTWESETTSEDGYDKRIMLDGMRAVEHYDKATKTGSLSVYVARRFFVQIELSNLDPKELYPWFKKLNIKGLSELK